ncbi:hypothetical protein F5X97DRAFT_290573 [Nemania serpens]|nr:hypothetical protein F5X97DRAFT_290573 [Nemania serpens]
MAPVQNTFSIIPDVPSVLNGNRNDGASSANARMGRPPMTTKQVKKAYQKANKQPKISKAEQRRQELFEQDRIRKEFEKEKNQARARAARDKKKEKEEQKRAEKKKKGLPLVDVRPSQDTIARFVRTRPKSPRDDGAPSLYGRGDEGESPSPLYTPSPADKGHGFEDQGQIPRFDEADKENVQPPVAIERGRSPRHVACVDNRPGLGDELARLDHVEPPSKKRRGAVLEEEYEGDEALLLIASEFLSPSPKPNPKVDVTSDHVEGALSPGATGGNPDADDGFSIIDISEENLLDDLLRETESVHGALNATKIKISGRQKDQLLPTKPPPPPPKPPENHVSFPKEPEQPTPCRERAARATEPLALPHQAALLPEPLLDTTKVSRQNPIPEKAMQVSTPPSFAVSPISRVRKSQPAAPGSQSFRHPRLPMAPPPALPKFMPSKRDSAGHPKTPQFLKPSPRPPPPPPPRTPIIGSRYPRKAEPTQVPENNPPPSTQLFILNHLDDFLPSPSQEVREIFDQPREQHVRNLSKATSRETYTHHKTFKPSLHIPKTLSTPYNRSVISAPDTNSKRLRPIQQVAGYPEPQKATAQPSSIHSISQNTPSTFEMPFFSTQDLLLSSQDVKDIEEDAPPPLPPKAQAPTPIPIKALVEPPEVPRHSPKQFFTSTCRELRYKCAIERSRRAAWEGPAAMQRAREELDKLQALEDERLKNLLANPGDWSDKKEQNEAPTVEKLGVTLDGAKSGAPAVGSHSTPAPRLQPPYSACREKTARNSTPSSGTILEATTLHQAQKPSHAQGSRARSKNSETYQRGTRPKGSYEAMLELLAKGPKQRSDARVNRVNQNPNRDGDGDTGGKEIREKEGKSEHPNRRNEITNEELEAMMTTIPASQETDYDCGEEWDDDDLLHGVL